MSSLAILTYHYVPAHNDALQRRILGPSREAFEMHVKYIKNHFQILSPEDIDLFMNGTNRTTQDPSVLLSFDDGLAEHVRYVSPFLESEGVKALFFVSSDTLSCLPLVPQILHYAFALYPARKVFSLLRQVFFELDGSIELPFDVHGDIPRNISLTKRFFREEIDHEIAREGLHSLYRLSLEKDFPDLFSQIYFNSDDIDLLLKAGHGIGAHTRSHLYLDRPVRGALLHKEIVDSIQKLSSVVNAKTRHFSFPYGKPGGEEVDDILKDEGVDFAYTAEETLNFPTTNPFRLARRSVYGRDTIDDIRAFICGNE